MIINKHKGMKGYNYQKINVLLEDYQLNNKNATIAIIAKEIGISYSAFNYLRNGTKKPTIDVIYKIAKFFEVTVNYFIDDMRLHPESKDDMNYKLNSPIDSYKNGKNFNQDDADPWRIAYELQKKNAELQLENELLKKACAAGNNAHVG